MTRRIAAGRGGPVEGGAGPSRDGAMGYSAARLWAMAAVSGSISPG